MPFGSVNKYWQRFGLQERSDVTCFSGKGRVLRPRSIREAPRGLEIARESFLQQMRAHHFDWHRTALEDFVVEFSLRHFAGRNLLRVQATKLHGAEHVAGLVERRIAAVGGGRRRKGSVNKS